MRWVVFEPSRSRLTRSKEITNYEDHDQQARSGAPRRCRPLRLAGVRRQLHLLRGGAAVFERVIKTYGPKVGQDVKNAYAKIKKVVVQEATKTAAKEAAKKLVKGVATKTAVGVVVDLLWPTRLDPR